MSLRAFGRVLLGGDPATIRELARAMVAHLAVFHSPDDLRIVVCASPDRVASWDWVKWFPHALHPSETDACGPVRLYAESLAGVEQLLPELGQRQRFTGASSTCPHVVVVLDGVGPQPDSPLAATDVDGVTLLDLDGTLPADARSGALRLSVTPDAVVRLTRDRAGNELRSPIGRPDHLSVPRAEALARLLAPLRSSVGGEPEEEVLSRDLGLMQLLGLGDARRLDVATTWRPRPPRDRLRVPIGVGPSGEAVELDIKEAAQAGMGPHGLVVGATGSGKSELLRTLVLGLAVTHPCETLNFVLVDFKGGATFARLEDLPHTSAVITNLADDLALVDRMRDALDGELNRRQELLRSSGNYAYVKDYERARENGASLAPDPQPVRRRRRVQRAAHGQTGLHRPVHHDRPDRPLPRRPPAARQPAPGGGPAARPGHVPVVPDRPAHLLRPGVAGGARRPGRLRAAVGPRARVPQGRHDDDAAVQGGLRVRPVLRSRGGSATMPGAVGHTAVPYSIGYLAPPPAPDPNVPATPQPGSAQAPDAEAETVLDVVVDQLVGRGTPAHQVWLPPLAEPPTLDQLLPPLGQDAAYGLCPVGWTGRGRLQVPVGLVDKPYDQRRDPMWLDLSGSRRSRRGRRRTAERQEHRRARPRHRARPHPHPGGGAVLLPGLRWRLPRRAARSAARRLGGRAAGARPGPAHHGRGHQPARPAGEAVRRAGHRLDGDLPADEGRGADHRRPVRRRLPRRRRLGHGPHRTSSRWSRASPRSRPAGSATASTSSSRRPAGWRSGPPLRDLLGTRIELRLGDPAESEIDRRVAVNVPQRTPGRGLTPDKLHFLSALPRIDADPVRRDVSMDGVADLVTRLAAAWTGPRAPVVQLLPEQLPYPDLPRPGSHAAAGTAKAPCRSASTRTRWHRCTSTCAPTRTCWCSVMRAAGSRTCCG